MPTITPMYEWFCLREGKENFTIIPERDHEFLFGKAEWKEDIETRLAEALILKEPVRLVWWGDFGIGKTQRLWYMRHVIDRDHLAFLPVMVTCRDLTTKSGFEALHYDLVNQLGIERVANWVASYRKKVELNVPGALAFTQLAATVVDVANAMERMGDTSKDGDIRRAAWRFLAGQALSPKNAELKLANVTKDQVDSSIEYAAILKCLAWVIRVEEGQQLLYLIDQMEALGNVTNRDYENAWGETMRAVLDIRELGIVSAIGAMRQDHLPAIMTRPEIFSRFKQVNYLQLAQYEPQTAEEFLRALFEAWIDPAKRDGVVATEKLSETPGYAAETYPFTKPAFDAFCAYLTNDPRDAKPREMLERLNRVAAKTCARKSRLITRDELVKQGIPA